MRLALKNVAVGALLMGVTSVFAQYSLTPAPQDVLQLSATGAVEVQHVEIRGGTDDAGVLALYIPEDSGGAQAV